MSKWQALYDKAPEYDTKCPDGFTCYGWRKINKGGYVRFAHGRHYDEELLPHVGKYVYVTLDDYLGINVLVWIDGPWQGTPLGAYNEKEWEEVKNSNKEV